MKSVAAIVDDSLDALAAGVREAFSALRYSEVLEAKTAERAAATKEKLAREEAVADKQKKLSADLRVELGKKLNAIRPKWPPSGPRAKGWGEFLARENIEERTARNYMELAGYISETPDAVSEIPSYRDVRDARRERDGDHRSPPDLINRERAEEAKEEDEAASVEIISGGSAIDLRLGDWQSVLLDIGTVDSVICDPPYGKRTHEAVTTRDDGCDPTGLTPTYEHWTADDVTAFVDAWAPRTRGWMACMTSDDLIPAWRAAYEAHGRFAFAPVPCVIKNMSWRKQGDGPGSWAVYLMVARPSNYVRWRSLRGAYIGPKERGAKSGRGKPLWLMDQIVTDYTNAGDFICDPFAGFGSTLLSGLRCKRRVVGSEQDSDARREAIIRWRAKEWDVAPVLEFDDATNIALEVG